MRTEAAPPAASPGFSHRVRSSSLQPAQMHGTGCRPQGRGATIWRRGNLREAPTLCVQPSPEAHASDQLRRLAQRADVTRMKAKWSTEIRGRPRLAETWEGVRANLKQICLKWTQVSCPSSAHWTEDSITQSLCDFSHTPPQTTKHTRRWDQVTENQEGAKDQYKQMLTIRKVRTWCLKYK